ncbi:glycosyltransferase family 4 protein [Chloroflexi bacterium TSY]|nr:glycosyltransferase family 4 protein [Chloroflexi bacterium TSY]
MKSSLILVGNQLKKHTQPSSGQECDHEPRRDYVEIGRRLGSTLVSYDLSNAIWYSWVRQVEMVAKLDFVEAAYALARYSGHNIVYSTSEKLAIPWAILSSIIKAEQPHIVMAHRLSSSFKKQFFRMWPIHKTFSHVISNSHAQIDYAVNRLGLPESRADFVYHNVDQQFFRPLALDVEDFILTVGLEQRDYELLFQALTGTNIRLVVVASSPWSTRGIDIASTANVTVLSHIPYTELRSLYARARLVVVPLFDIDYAAGSTTLLEAMAMGKSVIVTQTKGIADYVIHDETGVYVPPADANALREAILSLWHCPIKQHRLSMNARQVVEESMNIDVYADKVTAIMQHTLDVHNGVHIAEYT